MGYETLDDHAVAGLLAREAGDLLLDLRGRALAEGAGGWRLQAAGDRTAHDHLVARLAELRPDDAVLSEEGADDRSRLAAERTWIIDPLDGTQDFSRVGSAEWAVHVALVVDGRPVAGAVSVPAGGGLYGTAQHPVPGGTARERPIVVTSRSQWGHAEDVAAAIGGEVHATSGSASTPPAWTAPCWCSTSPARSCRACSSAAPSTRSRRGLPCAGRGRVVSRAL